MLKGSRRGSCSLKEAGLNAGSSYRLLVWDGQMVCGQSMCVGDATEPLLIKLLMLSYSDVAADGAAADGAKSADAAEGREAKVATAAAATGAGSAWKVAGKDGRAASSAKDKAGEDKGAKQPPKLQRRSLEIVARKQWTVDLLRGSVASKACRPMIRAHTPES